MSTTSNVPVTVTPEASAHVAELGLQKEFEQVLEHALQTIPGLRAVRADYESGYGVDIPCILIEATVSDYEAASSARDAWGVWRLTAIPPQAGQNFVLFLQEEQQNAG